MRITRFILFAAILILGSMVGMTCRKKNLPPDVPSIPSGPTSGRIGDTLRFSTVAEDPDGDSVAIRFDWGDSTRSEWSAFVRDGDSVAITHAWQKLGTYSITAQAKDKKETASAWSGGHQLTIASFLVTFGGIENDVGKSVQQTSDGGYVIVGYTESYGAGSFDVWLIKTDAERNKVWDKSFGGTSADCGNSVGQTSDGGYIIAGYTDSYGAGSADIWLIKTDADGNKVWDKTFGGSSDDWGSSVVQTTDGGYVVAGYTSSFGAGSYDVLVIKTDAYGKEVWSRTFGGTNIDEGFSVQQTVDSGYIIAGQSRSYGAGGFDVLLVKTDAQGYQVWTKTFGGDAHDQGSSVRQTSDGGYVIAGSTGDIASDHDVLLIKTDASGTEVWNRMFGGDGPDVAASVQQTSDGGFIITGSTYSYGAGYSDVWLVKTDALGNRVWDRTYGGANEDEGNSVQQTVDGGYVVAGYTIATGSGKDVLLIKTDADGN